MPRLRRAYVPRWIGAFVPAVTLPIWAWMTYDTFFAAPGAGEMTAGEWLLMTAVFAVVVGVVLLMAARRLPAYLIEEDDGE